MTSGWSTKLTGQVGEFLVCAELGRQLDLIATPFAGNVPQFDLLVADRQCRSIPIQVKTSRSKQWPSRADLWIKLTVENGKQIDHGDQVLQQPHLIYVYVTLRERLSETQNTAQTDRFFILTQRDLQQILAANYRAYMEKRHDRWVRPRKPASFDCRLNVEDIKAFENNWESIQKQLAAQGFHAPLVP